MTDDAKTTLRSALDQLKAFVDWDEHDVVGIDLDEARAILAYIADLEARAEKAEAREAELRAVLKGVDDDVRHHLRSDRVDHAVLRKHVVQMVRQALAAAPTAPVIPRLNIRCETTNGHVTVSNYINVVRVEAEDDGSFTAVTDHWLAR